MKYVDASAVLRFLFREGGPAVPFGEGRLVSSRLVEVGIPEGRVRYVEYEDGTVDGDLDHSAAREAFEPLRTAVWDYAREFTMVAQYGGRPAIEKALAAAQPSDPTARTARDTIAVHVKAVEDAVERLERLARQ